MGKRAWIESGKALRTIRDSRLYRESFATFEQYVEQKWGMARANAYRMIDGATVFENVSHGGHSETTPERQIRPLTKLPPEKQDKTFPRFMDGLAK